MNENTQQDEPADLSENETDEVAEEQGEDDEEKPVQLTGERRRKTLYDHLALFESIDNGEMDITDEEVEELMFQTGGKVDSCQYIHKRLNMLEVMWEIERKAAIEKRDRAKANRERLEKAMLKALDKNGFEKFPGHNWLLQKKTTTKVEMTTKVTDLMAALYPKLFKTTITPAKIPIRKYIEAGNTVDFAQIRENKKIEFKPNLEAGASTKRGKK